MVQKLGQENMAVVDSGGRKWRFNCIPKCMVY